MLNSYPKNSVYKLSFILLLLVSIKVQGFRAIWEERTLVRKFEANTVNRFQKEPLKININIANKESLQRLHGIGAKKAQAIIDYRLEKGDLKSANDLLKIKGFTPKILRKIIEKNKETLTLE